MTKFGQAEYNDYMAKMFVSKLDKILETSENRISATEIQKIFTENFRPQRMLHRRKIC